MAAEGVNTRMNPHESHANLFRSSWPVYDAIIERNYMFHREIHACVGNVLGARSARGGYALLDLGCGNARLLADTLRTFPPLSYVGVDLSRAALDEAAIQLQELPSVELREQDMLACALAASPGSVDVVYSSFAIHHLSVADKQRLFRAVAELLTPGGDFLLVDVVREENQTREQYLEKYLRMMQTEWTVIEQQQIEEVCRHVATYDFPETFPALAVMAQAAGFRDVRELGRFRQHWALRFRR